MAYEKTEQLLELATMMQANREGVSLNDIVNKFGVSRRTAERMRDMIKLQFPQTQETMDIDGFKRWYIPQGTLRDFIQFSAEEVALLETLKTLLKKNNMADKTETLERLTDKIKANVDAKVLRRLDIDAEALMMAEGFVCRPGPKLKIDPALVSEIRDSILSCHRIRIKYIVRSTGKICHNTIEPYGFLYGERKHYLIARHSGKYDDGKPRSFILNNIKSVEILPETFVMDENFNLREYAEESFGSYHEPPFDVEWLFDAVVADEAAQYVFHPKQETVRNEDGSLTVKFRAGGRLEMDWHLYTWGKHVTVVKPENWREMVDNAC